MSLTHPFEYVRNSASLTQPLTFSAKFFVYITSTIVSDLLEPFAVDYTHLQSSEGCFEENLGRKSGYLSLFVIISSTRDRLTLKSLAELVRSVRGRLPVTSESRLVRKCDGRRRHCA